MKKLLFCSVFATAGLMMFPSCKKTYVCNCTSVTKINDSTITTGSSTKEYRATRRNAKDDCTGSSSSSMFGPYVLTTTETCAIQ